jgi:GPH family glycoside/pentoside/hexuronide:cation symporter
MIDTDPPTADAIAAHAAQRAQRLPLSSTLAYASGSTLDAAVNTSINVFLLFYVTTACGMEAGMAGAAIALGLIVESLIDPLIGLYSDNFRSRWGRRLPFMVAGVPVLLVSYVLLFSLPDTTDQWSLFALVATLSAVVRIALSIYNLPYLAAGAELGDDQTDRERLISLRWTASIIAAFVTVAVGFTVYFGGENGLAQRANYAPYALTMAAVMLGAALMAISVVSRTRDRQHLVEVRPTSLRSIALEFSELLRSRSFRVLFSVALLFAAAQAVVQSLNLHAFTFFWKLDTAQTQFATLAITGGMMLGALIAAPAIARTEYRTAAVIGLFGIILMQAGAPSLRLAGLLALEGQALTYVLSGFSLVAGMMTTIVAIAVVTMITNAADEHEHLFGVRREGSYFAGWTLAFKIAGGLGTLLSGLALEAIGFPVQQVKEQGVTIVLPQTMTDMLGLFYGPGAAVLSLASLALLFLFRLDRAGHRRILAELNARRHPVRDSAGPSTAPERA